MTIKVTSKNVDLGESLRTYAEDRILAAVDKYSHRPATGHVSVEKASRGGFSTLCAIYLDSGIDLQANGEAADAYASVDAAIERLEKRLRRYKRRLKNHHHHGASPAAGDSGMGVDYVIRTGDEDDEGAGPERDEDGPVIVAELPARVRQMSVSDAVMQMDLADQTFLVFRNANHGGVNVVYRRADGNIGWIDPSGVVSQE
jgi:ribosomal subunit interface protein